MQIYHYWKSTTMTLGTRQQAGQVISNTQLNPVISQKLLGVHIDETLSWKQHIDYLCSIISSTISLLRQLSNYAPENVQKLFYQSYVLPLIDYGSISCGSTTKLNIGRINKLQKRAAHFILKVDYITSTVEMFQRLRWMTVSQRKAVLTYKALNYLTPAYISDLRTPTAIAYNRNLSSSENGSLMVQKTRTSFYTGSFTVSAPKLWTTFPTSVKQAASLNTFKRAMIEFISF